MFFTDILGNIMKFLYELVNNYGLAIIIFTLISKIILLPLSIMVQNNSIKMIKITPALNKIKIKYFGDKDQISEEEANLYKKEKYNPFISLFPLIIQIVILLGLVEVINHPLTYIVKVDSNDIDKYNLIVSKENNININSSSIELDVVNDIKNGNNLDKYNKIDRDTVKKIKDLDLNFLGFDLSWVASVEKGISYLVPIIAGLSALILCIGQNKMNVLQKEQSNYNKYGMLLLSVFLSLYLGMFVASGVALYWIISNLLAILQQYLLNIFINPKKYINYKELEETNKELNRLKNIDKAKGKRSIEQIRKEKQDYKKFFKIVNKHLVFYSESNGFYKYYKGIIEYILNNTNIVIHYITSDYNDNIFKMEKEYPNLKAYYIEEKKLITLMMKMDCDVLVMTMPDIDTYHIKRSYVRKDIEYIYIPHCMDSLNMTMRYKSCDHYDTVFVVGPSQEEEMVKTNELHKLKNRKIFKWGYTLLDDMINNYHEKKPSKVKTILISPSWQKDNIIDLCLDDILDKLKDKDFNIIVRPHPQHVRHMKDRIDSLKDKYKDNKNVLIQTDFSSNDTVFNADLMITDWSGIAYEYSFTTLKPVIFIDTPMKVMNPNYEEIDTIPSNIWLRNKIGKSIKLTEIKKIDKEVDTMLKDNLKYKDSIKKLRSEFVYNLGSSDIEGANYIIEEIQKKIKERRK